MDDVLLCDNLSNHDNDEVEEEDEEKGRSVGSSEHR